mmetsp:Transcript_26841/g.71984  ORF Transcript_26841/g.71984 Transcript_26841/m.71984 type:complete len:278 (-) Transcript_26841:1239-2072(-)
MPASTLGGSSCRSFSFLAGMITSRMPARCAATTFSLMPPTGSTLPRRVTSPVMATSDRTVRPVSRDTSAVVIVTPADGPSLGIAPAGKWMWRSVALKRWRVPDAERPSGIACERIHESAALALSCMTSPSWPVSMSCPEPPMRSASTKRMAPPTEVYARPVAMPGREMRCAVSFRPSNLGGPSTALNLSTLIARPSSSSAASPAAATPASSPTAPSALAPPSAASVALLPAVALSAPSAVPFAAAPSSAVAPAAQSSSSLSLARATRAATDRQMAAS